MKGTVSVDEFIEKYANALRDRNAAVMVGAGLSIPAGLVDWKKLLKSIAKEVDLDIDRETDLIAVAQYHYNDRGRAGINQALIDELLKKTRMTENHQILTRLPIDVYWTTNYDPLIEKSLEGQHRLADVKKSAGDFGVTVSRRDAIVYKMHGDISNPDEAVVTKDDYEGYGEEARGQLFTTALRGDLVSKTFLWVGFSFSDPNVGYILARVRILLGKSGPARHYCLLRRVQRAEFSTKAEFEYAKIKQNHQIADLVRYGIMSVVVDSYDEYTKVLQQLERRHRSRQVFISGSAVEYGPWSKAEDGQAFISKLSSRLIAADLNVVSGFGLGVGPHVVNGVLDQLEADGTRNISDRLILRPFPYAIANPTKRRQRWTTYRHDILSNAGIAIFVFGNKKDDSIGAIVDADGMMEEYEIARSKGLWVVPVGVTGHLAKQLHATVMSDFATLMPNVSGLKGALTSLGRSGTTDEIVDRVIRVTELLTQARPS